MVGASDCNGHRCLILAVVACKIYVAIVAMKYIECYVLWGDPRVGALCK